MDSKIVIKVKYGETLRRFNAQVNDGGNLDIDMLRLREKIINLFGFSPETDFTLTYVDEDGDVVTLVDDDDLYDVMNQSLNPLRITVKLNNRNGGFSTRSSGSSTPMRSHQPFDLNGISKVMKSVPEPLRETLSKLSLEVASKASHTGPIIAGLVDSLSKLGQSVNPETPRRNDVSVPVPAQNSDIKQTPVKFGTQNGKESEVNDAVGDGKQKVEKTDGFRPFVIKPINQAKRDSKSANVDGVKATKFPRGPGNSAVSQLVLNPTNESPFQGSGLSFGGPGPCPFKRSYRRNNGMGGSVYHRGIRCDGCGVHPITGLRFKSKVKEDYDLCSNCFTNLGNEDDYLRIDRPVTRSPNLVRELDGSEQFPSDVFHGMINMREHLKLDGRFVMDINVLDGTVLAPSTQFTKIWRMTNNGRASWPRGTELVWIGGDKFSSITRAALQISVEGLAVGKEIDIAVDFCAPEFPGRYISYWRLSSPSGPTFGQRVWVLIEVDAALKDPLSERLSGLNLNLPPVSSDTNDVDIDMNFDPMMEDKAHVTDDYINTEENEPEPVFPTLTDHVSAVKQVDPLVQAYAKKIEGTGYPIFGTWSVGSGSGSAGSVVFPTKPNFSIHPSLLAVGSIGNSVQPIIDMKEAAPTAPVAAPVAAPTAPVAAPTAPVAAPTAQVADDNNDVELTLLKELEDMGFMEINLNKEILRKNEYDFEQSVDELCGVSEWDPILEELNEMGFSNKEMNKRLLKKNNGSIKRVVLDLIAGEKA
ncbi:protein JOKA2 [Impatiens glandulifera]|uniref:protein JOKA2 n=1 Tax=Impatiens glandulifera TaxID=253017 RepID=UPI001FB07CD4|nr:protein JOKA2 [Impatiens glandulifera]XP_047329940.1 protein JOKA2 [Impatiens glandulifera]